MEDIALMEECVLHSSASGIINGGASGALLVRLHAIERRSSHDDMHLAMLFRGDRAAELWM